MTNNADTSSHALRMAQLRLRAIVGAQRGGAGAEGGAGVSSGAGASSSAGVSSGAGAGRGAGVSSGAHADLEVSEFGQAVGLVVDDVAWVLVTGRHERSLG
ncbi:MAG: hypothetical protein ACKO93_04560, partial [Acidimicrobiaceae bacterium]